MRMSNVLPELQILLHHRLRASEGRLRALEGQTEDEPAPMEQSRRPAPTLCGTGRGTSSLSSRGLLYAQNRQLLEECRQNGEDYKNLMETQKRMQQECAEFAALNSSLLDSQERLQEECGQYEIHKSRLASELSDYQAIERDLMAHERDLVASQARLMHDYEAREAENEFLKRAQQMLFDAYEEQLKENSFPLDIKDAFPVESVFSKAELAETLPMIEKQGAPERTRSQPEPDPEADADDQPSEAEEQRQVEVEEPPAQGSPQLDACSEGSQSDACSEGRLRRVLTSHTSTTEELREAIASVESLMSEARRELAARELRERRAGYEQLHNAMEGRDASALEEAIAVACRVGVDAADIEKAEAKLELLKSISDEERAAQEAQLELAERKRRSFQLVKQGKVLALRELLGGDGSNDAGSKSWMQWKDHSGRSLLSYAKELRAATVQECLECMMSNNNEAEPVEPSMPVEKTTPEQEITEEMPTILVTCASQRPLLATEDLPDECSPQLDALVTTPLLAPWSPQSDTTVVLSTWSPQSDATGVVTKFDSEWPATSAKLMESLQEARNPPAPEEKEAGSCLSAAELEALRAQAFKAVVKDDTVTLADVMAKVPNDTWSSWQNKAAKDLLTLAQERRSPASYSMMAKELGILQERKHDSFEERETVWVLLPGEVQARHATVLEDTSADATKVLVEFWESDGPPSKVDHALVMKAT